MLIGRYSPTPQQRLRVNSGHVLITHHPLPRPHVTKHLGPCALEGGKGASSPHLETPYAPHWGMRDISALKASLIDLPSESPTSVRIEPMNPSHKAKDGYILI